MESLVNWVGSFFGGGDASYEAPAERERSRTATEATGTLGLPSISQPQGLIDVALYALAHACDSGDHPRVLARSLARYFDCYSLQTEPEAASLHRQLCFAESRTVGLFLQMLNASFL